MSEAFKAVLLKYDAETEEMDTSEKQDAFLRDLLAAQDLRYSLKGSAGPSKHTYESLKKSLGSVVHRNMIGPKGSKYRSYLDRFFQEGSSCLKPEYLKAIGYQFPLAAASSDEHTPDATSQAAEMTGDSAKFQPVMPGDEELYVKPSRRKRKASEETEEIDILPPRKAAKMMNYAESEDDSGTGEGLDSSKVPAAVHTEPPRYRRLKRGRRATPEDDEATSDERPQKLQKVRGSLDGEADLQSSVHSLEQAPTSQHEGASGEAEGDVGQTGAHDSNQVTSPTETRDTEATAPPSPSAKYNGKQKDPVSHASNSGKEASSKRDDTDAKLADKTYQTSRDFLRPNVIGECLPFALLRDEFDRQFNRLDAQVNYIVVAYLRDLDIDTLGVSEVADVVTYPTPPLEELYRSTFGYDWRDYSIELQSIGRLHCYDLLKSLISSFLVQRVFNSDKLPWKSPLNVFDDPSMECVKKYLGELVAERNAEFSKIIREASMRQIRSEEFQDSTVASEASVLAYEFLHTTHVQMAYMRANRSPTHGWLERLKTNLKRAFKQALTLHAMTLASCDTYRIIWPAGPAKFDGRTMQTMDGPLPEDGTKNYLPLFPGWECDSAQKMYGKIMYATATVYTDLSHPKGIPRRE